MRIFKLLCLLALMALTDWVNAGLGACDDLSLIEETAGVDFELEIQPIFDANCISCHGGKEPIAFMDLTQGYQQLVSVPSFQVSELSRIEPGNISLSYLFFKINCGNQLLGDRMPRDASPLSVYDQALIRDWINQIIIFKNSFD